MAPAVPDGAVPEKLVGDETVRDGAGGGVVAPTPVPRA